jgi:hypothetical protein
MTTRHDVKRAVRFLKDLLRDGPLLAQDVYFYGVDKEGLEKRALWVAKEKLGIELTNINKLSPHAHYRCWLWSLPTTEKKQQPVPADGQFTTSGEPPKRDERYWQSLPPWDGKTPPWEDQQ